MVFTVVLIWMSLIQKERLIKVIHSGFRVHWLCCMCLIHSKELPRQSHLFRNWATVIVQTVFDSLKRTDSEAFVWKSFYTWLYSMCLIYSKEPTHESHSFWIQATLIVPHVFNWTNSLSWLKCLLEYVWLTKKNRIRIICLGIRIHMVIKHVFDLLKRTDSLKSSVRKSDYTSCTVYVCFTRNNH